MSDSPSAVRIGQARLVVLGVAVVVLASKLWLASRTLGTNDILYWSDFLKQERAAGPVGMYGLPQRQPPLYSFYNHPPLMGYVLSFVNWLQRVGVSFRFTIRALSSLADIGSAMVAFALIRRRRSLREATWAGALVGASPVLWWVSGFHGNTDPIFTFLTFLAVWFLVDSRRPGVSGAVIALAIGIKIIPMVVVPCLLVYAWRTRRVEAYRFAGAFAVVVAITWGPALLHQWRPVLHNVIGYPGTGPSGWGILQLGHYLGDPWWVGFLAGPGRTLSVLIAAAVPAVAVWRRPDTVLYAAAWSLIAFLAAAVSFGIQYTVWPVIACYVIGLGWGALYNLAAGLLVTQVYLSWIPYGRHRQGYPLYQALAVGWTPGQITGLLILWLIILVITVRAAVGLFGPARRADPSHRSGSHQSAAERRVRDSPPWPKNSNNVITNPRWSHGPDNPA